MEEFGIYKIRIGRKSDNLERDCLAFADDLAHPAESAEDVIKQINILKRTAEIAGLEVSFEKTKYVTNVKEAQNYMEIKYGRINKVIN